MKVLGVIPARGGSKRVPRKNLRPLGGKPLIAWTLDAARQAKSLNYWAVSTEDREIADIASALGAFVIKRPEELATDDATTGDVLLHALEWLEPSTYDMVVCLHPTSPIRDAKHIDQAVAILGASTAPSLASVVYDKRSYRHNASIYATKVPFRALYGSNTIPFLMDKRHSLDIDEEIDLKIAELFLQER